MGEKERDLKQYGIDVIAAMAERTVKRLWIIIILLIVLFVGSNAAWIWYESQFIDEEWTFEADADGDSNAIANGNGEVYFYGSARESNP